MQSPIRPLVPPVIPSTTPVVIVFEKRPRWAPELQRQFLNELVRVIACRSVRDVEERLAGVARGAVLLDASAAPAECVQFLKNGLLNPEALPVIVVATAQLAEREWSFRELGAIAFLSGRNSGHAMASLCRRQWRGQQRQEPGTSYQQQGRAAHDE
jgi:DNA-binding NtrC family response regulator